MELYRKHWEDNMPYKLISFEQGKYGLVVFCAPVNDIYEHFSINRRIEDKDEGYQRAYPKAGLT